LDIPVKETDLPFFGDKSGVFPGFSGKGKLTIPSGKVKKKGEQTKKNRPPSISPVPLLES